MHSVKNTLSVKLPVWTLKYEAGVYQENLLFSYNYSSVMKKLSPNTTYHHKLIFVGLQGEWSNTIADRLVSIFISMATNKLPTLITF